jgi:hypothetical protein
MTHYRAQPEDDAVLIVLCAVRDGQFGKSALNEVIDLWVAGQIGRVEALEVIAGANENTMRQWEGEAKRLRHQLAGAVDERDRLREVLRAALIEPDPIKRNQLAAPVLTVGAVAR